MSNFFKQTFASLIGSFFGLCLFFGVGTGGLILLLVSLASQETGPTVRDRSVLVFDLSTTITDTDPVTSASEALGEALSGEESSTLTLRTVLETIEKATKDDRIIAIYLDGTGQGSPTGFATLKEVRTALQKFRAAGKKIIAYDLEWSKRDYYLASVADEVIINPIGVVEMNGLSSEQMFLTGALQKYGVGVQVIRVGKFKSAVEPFVLKQLSVENRQQTQNFLGDLWGEFITTTGQSRRVNPKQLQALADTKGILTAPEAKQQKLVDKVAYFDQVLAQLKTLTKSDADDRTFRQINLKAYASVDAPQQKPRSSANKVAILYAEGDIVDGQGERGQIGGDSFARQLRRLRQDKDVKAVVLRINTPGGSASASEVIQREVRLTRQVKPVVVSMGDIAASGGYWIATYGDRIFAQSNTITGSIGVFGLLLNVQKLANDNGVTWDVVKTSRLADSSTVSRPKTPQELAVYQGFVNRIYGQFINKVAQSRKLSVNQVQAIAQGRVWSGQDAKNLGLVDEIGGLQAAINYAAKKANLGEDWEIKDYPRSRSLEQRLFGQLSGEDAAVSAKPDLLTQEFMKLQKDLKVLQNFNDPVHVYARLPFNFRLD